MGDLILGVAKTVVEGTLIKVRSAIDEETKLKESVQRDLVFITGEFEMMQCFLNVTSEEGAKNVVVKAWVRQLRDLAFDVEDCIEFVLHLDDKSAWWWRVVPSCIAPTLPLDLAVANIKTLKERVIDISQRNMRYNITGDSSSGSKPPVITPAVTGAAETFDMLVEAQAAAKRQNGLRDLGRLINREDRDLQVVSLWGTSSDVGMKSIITKAYDDPETCRNFTCRAWVKLVHPFNPHEFIRSLLAQFFADSCQDKQTAIGVDVMTMMQAATRTEEHLKEEFLSRVHKHRYLVVLENLCSMVDWRTAKTYLPDINNGSRIVVSTQQFEIATLCTGHPHNISEIRQFSLDHSVCVLFKEGSQYDGDKFKYEARDFQPFESEAANILDILKGVDTEIRHDGKSLAFKVMSVWGISGVDKSALVRSIYRGQMTRQYSHRWGKFAWVNIACSQDLEEFYRSLLWDLCSITTEAEENEYRANRYMSYEKRCCDILREHRCLLVIDGLEHMKQWDEIYTALNLGAAKGRTIAITEQKSIALHCADNADLVCHVKTSPSDATGFLKDQGSERDGDTKCQDQVTDSHPFDSEAARIHDMLRVDNQFGRNKSLGFQPSESEAINFETSEHDDARDLSKQQGSQRDKGKQHDEFSHMVAPTTQENFHLFGRRSEAAKILEIFDKIDSEISYPQKYPVSFRVMSVWGIAGIGKSYLVRSIYRDQMKFKYSHRWSKQAWADVPHPFNLRELCQSLLLSLSSESGSGKVEEYFGMSLAEDPIKECRDILREHRCLVVIDHLLSIEDWGTINTALGLGSTKAYTIVITSEESIAIQCADTYSICNIGSLQPDATLQLYKDQINKSTSYIRSDIEEEELALVKSGGLPKVITAVCRYIVSKRSMWELKYGFIDILKNSLYCGDLEDFFIWMQSYFRSCPDFLKPCVFYLPIFPPNYNIRRRRLLRRWIAEGYCMSTISAIAESNAETSFEKLMSLSMIQEPPQGINLPGSGINFCQINGFFHEYIMSQPKEDNMVFALGGADQSQQYTGRHLTIRSNWNRSELFEIIDFSRLRSLTVFGEWRSFFISKKMQMLRVLDLEDTTSDVSDEDVEQIVDIMSRLKFLSLRGCTTVSRLPTSLGNLKQLETLDVRHTSITMLPETITKLQKLQYIRAGSTVPSTESQSIQPGSYRLPKFRRHQFISAHLGVKVPRGVGKLTGLDTLGVVNVGASGGNAFLKELKNLTQVCKLAVSGINRQNIVDFVSAISAHSLLDSLSMRLDKDGKGALCSVNDISEPQEILLTSLKIHGDVDNFPAWMKLFFSLGKLDLEVTILTQEMIDTLADGNFKCLRLCVKPTEDGRRFLG
nr:disease resistance protein Pik-2-like isoform X3 [Lolium perenne]